MSAVSLSDTHAVSPSVELIASIEVHNGSLHSATAVLTQMIARVPLDVAWRPDSFLHESLSETVVFGVITRCRI